MSVGASTPGTRSGACDCQRAASEPLRTLVWRPRPCRHARRDLVAESAASSSPPPSKEMWSTPWARSRRPARTSIATTWSGPAGLQPEPTGCCGVRLQAGDEVRDGPVVRLRDDEDVRLLSEAGDRRRVRIRPVFHFLATMPPTRPRNPSSASTGVALLVGQPREGDRAAGAGTSGLGCCRPGRRPSRPGERAGRRSSRRPARFRRASSSSEMSLPPAPGPMPLLVLPHAATVSGATPAIATRASRRRPLTERLVRDTDLSSVPSLAPSPGCERPRT